MECLDATAVQDLVAGALDAPAYAAAMAHLGGCPDCRGLLSQLSPGAPRSAAAAAPAASAPPRAADALAATMASAIPVAAPTDALAATGIIPAATAAAAAAAAVATAVEAAARATAPPAPDDAVPDQTGRILGRYTLAEPLGAGAMGVVHRARDRDLSRDVAVKLLRRPDGALTDRLIREARSMARVNHPNVVAIYDVGVAGGSTYIAMELVIGTSLRAWQAEHRGIPELIEAYTAAGRGLAAAHAAGVVHRDFKPDNVLVGADGRVRVTDFGLAAARAGAGVEAAPSAAHTASVSATARVRAIEASAEASASASAIEASAIDADVVLTRSGVVLGTPAYMAPEQFNGGNVDPRTDQFNFCVALYEALYGARPFTGRTFEELGTNVSDGAVQPPPARTQISRALRAILLRGLSARPGDRFPTMDHLLAELGRDRARPWRRAALAAGALAIFLGVGIAADAMLRGRVAAASGRAFDDTGKQIERAFGLLVRTFDINANQMYLQPAMRAAAAYHDEVDFGLGTAEGDAEHLEKVRAELVSTDWTLWSRSIDAVGASGTLVVAVADANGRLLYTSAAPGRWGADLTRLPWLGPLTHGTEKAITLQPAREPRLAESGILGPAPAARLGFFFARTLVLNGERSGYLVQAVDAAQLLADIALDDETLLAIAEPGGELAGAVPAALAAAAPRDGATAEVHHGGTAYQVKAQALTGLDGRPVGHVVMARELGGVLAGLFPGARVAFALAMLAALSIAAAAAVRARRVTGARA
jgi:tRNA A-37 threonylcarbamoyl transferase component Bud32